MSYTMEFNEPVQKRFKVDHVNPGTNTPIKEVVQPLLTHNWIGVGTLDRRTRRILFTPVPVTPTKHLDGKLIR
jgi:hypothetical protein